MIECSTCGYPVEEGDRFCGNCRADLGISNREQGTPNVEVEGPSSVSDSTLDIRNSGEAEPSCSSSLRGGNPVVEFNASRILLEGSVLPLEFRIHFPEPLSNVELAVRSAKGIKVRHRVPNFVSGQDLFLDVAVPKECSGTLGFEVVFKYRVDGRVVEMHGHCRHEICPAAGDGNITVDIQQGHAGDIQVSGLKELAAMNDKRTILRELNAIESRWEKLPLQVVSEKAAESNGHESVVVETPTGPLRLFAGSCLTFGRGRENDIVTRITQLSSGLLDPANPNNPNRFISSRHGWMHLTQDGVFVVDGDMVGGKPSGGGTFLDGQRITREKLPAHSVELSLCGEDASLPTIYSLRITASDEGIVLRPPEPRAGAFLWLFGALDFEGNTYEHRASGFFRDGEKIR